MVACPAHHGQFAPGVGVADERRRVIGKHAGHRRQVADVAVDDSEQSDDRGLVGGDAVEIAHLLGGRLELGWPWQIVY